MCWLKKNRIITQSKKNSLMKREHIHKGAFNNCTGNAKHSSEDKEINLYKNVLIKGIQGH